MKAYIVNDKWKDYATVVFAESAGKAKSLDLTTEACEDSDFCDIEARRAFALDKFYKEGKIEMNWLNPNDRIALVKEAGFHCVDVDVIDGICEECEAKEWCVVCEKK